MSTSREVVRDALVTLLTAALVGTDLPVLTVVGSQPSTLDSVTPLVAVLSMGTLRERMTFMGDKPTFFLQLQVWVRQKDIGWTPAEAEDVLDKIESLIADVVSDEVSTANWASLEYTGRTAVSEEPVAGKQYYLEVIPVTVNTTKE